MKHELTALSKDVAVWSKFVLRLRPLLFITL